MTLRGSRLVRPAAVLVVTAAVAALGAAYLIWRWRTAGPEGVFLWSSPPGSGDERMGWSAEGGLRGRNVPSLPHVPPIAADPRLAPLRRAAESWRQSLGPRRAVVDQVCLVPDVPSFLEVIAAWDDRQFFPILIDEPEWTLPFLRAFRPARVVRYAARGEPGASSPAGVAGSGSGWTSDRMWLWRAALDAVARGWSPPSGPDAELPPAGAAPRALGATPPGVVLSAPDSPMLAGAVALAAGRFQPLIRIEPGLWGLDDSGGGAALRYGDVLTVSQAWRFAQHLEAQVAGIVPRYDQLGDDCDFLTIAGDWPYRYDDRVEAGPAHGIQALDDLIGRNLVGEPDARGLGGSRRRWAFTGRLLGDPAASVARAMGALFLSPDLSLLWDTYEPGSSYSDYTAAPAAHLLGRARVVPDKVFYAVGQGASLANWHRIMDPWNRFGLIWVNTWGYPTEFAIAGGTGVPADLAGGCPAAVVMIHSFSAADPADPETIAGRWLTQGAFVYFGSVNEPYLHAFRKPGLVADLALRGVPLSAALRQGESEPLGRPWRLVYLGDPLYRIPVTRPLQDAATAADVARAEPSGRLSPESWRGLAPAYADWPAMMVDAGSEAPAPGADAPADRRLRWCHDAAVAELTGRSRIAAGRGGPEWRPVLTQLTREQLDPRLRPAFDELIIEVLSQSGDWDDLQARLSRIPPARRRPRVWAAMENAAVFRLARAARDPDPERRRARIDELREDVRRAAWPDGSRFPAQFAARVAAEGVR